MPEEKWYQNPEKASQAAAVIILALAALLTWLFAGEEVKKMFALAVSGDVTDLPVLRPVIGMDKSEIVEIARKIDTFDISIEPYEDCCTVFTPKHPKTKPILEEVIAAQNSFDFEPLIQKAVEETEVKRFNIC